LGEIDMRSETLLEKALKAHRPDAGLHGRVAERTYILGGGPLGLVVNEGTLEDQGMRRIDHHKTGDPPGMAQRRQPGGRPAPVMADQGEALDFQRVG
jgi:hypothetical protein